MRQVDVVDKYFKMAQVNPSLVIPVGFDTDKVITGTYFLKLELADLTNQDNLPLIMESVDKMLEKHGCSQQPKFKLLKTDLGIDINYIRCDESISSLSLYAVQSHPYKYPFLSLRGSRCEQI